MSRVDEVLLQYSPFLNDEVYPAALAWENEGRIDLEELRRFDSLRRSRPRDDQRILTNVLSDRALDGRLQTTEDPPRDLAWKVLRLVCGTGVAKRVDAIIKVYQFTYDRSPTPKPKRPERCSPEEVGWLLAAFNKVKPAADPKDHFGLSDATGVDRLVGLLTRWVTGIKQSRAEYETAEDEAGKQRREIASADAQMLARYEESQTVKALRGQVKEVEAEAKQYKLDAAKAAKQNRLDQMIELGAKFKDCQAEADRLKREADDKVVEEKTKLEANQQQLRKTMGKEARKPTKPVGRVPADQPPPTFAGNGGPVEKRVGDLRLEADRLEIEAKKRFDIGDDLRKAGRRQEAHETDTLGLESQDRASELRKEANELEQKFRLEAAKKAAEPPAAARGNGLDDSMTDIRRHLADLLAEQLTAVKARDMKRAGEIQGMIETVRQSLELLQ